MTSMSAANFPYQGRIENPTIDDYRTELKLIRDAGTYVDRLSRERLKPYHYDRWSTLIRRLQWMRDKNRQATSSP